MKRTLFCFCLTFLAAASGCGQESAESPAPPKVLEPPLSEFKPTGNRWRRQYAEYVGFEVPPEKVARLKATYGKHLNKCYEYYWLEDEWRIQESRWFDKWAQEHWLLTGNAGKFKQESRGGALRISCEPG